MTALPCNDCNGQGVRVETTTIGGKTIQVTRTCTRCGGRGVVG